MTSSSDDRIVDIAKAKAEQTVAFNRATYGEVIRASRIRQGLSQPQLAAILHTSKNYVSNWEIGKARPDMNILPALCDALRISLEEFFGNRTGYASLTYEQQQFMQAYIGLNDRDRRIVEDLAESLSNMEYRELRERCRSIFTNIFHNDNVAAAGTFNDLGEDAEGEDEFIRLSDLSERADEIITVTGDSMEPTFHAGDDLLIEHTETLRPGEIGIFIINGEGFVKEYRENGVYSHNAKAYPFRKFLPDDNVRIVGRVLGKITEKDRPTKAEAAMLDELRREGKI